VNPLLGNDLEISNYTTAVAMWRLRKQARFHDNDYTATEERHFLCGPCRDVEARQVESYNKLRIEEAGRWGRGQFESTEAEERPPLKPLPGSG
jgi:hypothetical protein